MINNTVIARPARAEAIQNPKELLDCFVNTREDFPIFSKKIRGYPLAYLDSAATTQKPNCVINTLTNTYSNTNANIHRGVHYLSEEATAQYEKARQTVQRFINAKSSKECVFVRGTTEAINLVAHSFGQMCIRENDEIIISALEHHSNIVPWQLLCQRTGAKLKVIPMNTQGELLVEVLEQLITPKTKLLAITHISNALGTINPIAEMIQFAHNFGIPVLIDGAQSAPHLKIDVQALDCDFFTFSSHKTYGPTGIGVLYAKEHWLEKMPPYQGGGEMILKVTLNESLYNDIPYKFEAGTPAIAETIALGTALDYLMTIGLEKISAYETYLLKEAELALSSIPGLKIIGTAKHKAASIAFLLDDIHPHDIGSIVDQKGVAIRTGHHCAMPIMDFFGISSTARASFGIYNNLQDIEQLVNALYEVKKIFQGKK